MLSITVGDKELRFEHSLVSLSEWEAEFEKPFYSDKDDKTELQTLRYLEIMYVGKEKNRDLVGLLDEDQILELIQYINEPRTATIVREVKGKAAPKETVTSELIYFWLVSFRIPFKPTDEWHLNRLLTLVKVCGIKQQTPEKRKSGDVAKDYRQLNEERRKLYGSKG